MKRTILLDADIVAYKAACLNQKDYAHRGTDR
jgi:hypothetical protein